MNHEPENPTEANGEGERDPLEHLEYCCPRFPITREVEDDDLRDDYGRPAFEIYPERGEPLTVAEAREYFRDVAAGLLLHAETQEEAHAAYQLARENRVDFSGFGWTVHEVCDLKMGVLGLLSVPEMTRYHEAFGEIEELISQANAKPRSKESARSTRRLLTGTGV